MNYIFTPQKKEICLTFDIEERFHAHYPKIDVPHEWRHASTVELILDHLSENNKKATFFVVGEFAEKYPSIIKRMDSDGNDIGSHTYSHIRLDKNSKETIKQDIKRSKSVLEDIIGKPIYGFRTPSWLIRLRDKWFWEFLSDIGFIYDSSLCPFKTTLYGSFDNPISPFRLTDKIIEIPPAVYKRGFFRLPYGGGFFFRLLPLPLTRFLLNTDLKNNTTPVLYFHPSDFLVQQNHIEKGLLSKFIANVNVKQAWNNYVELVSKLGTITCLDFYKRLKDKI